MAGIADDATLQKEEADMWRPRTRRARTEG